MTHPTRDSPGLSPVMVAFLIAATGFHHFQPITNVLEKVNKCIHPKPRRPPKPVEEFPSGDVPEAVLRMFLSLPRYTSINEDIRNTSHYSLAEDVCVNPDVLVPPMRHYDLLDNFIPDRVFRSWAGLPSNVCTNTLLENNSLHGLPENVCINPVVIKESLSSRLRPSIAHPFPDRREESWRKYIVGGAVTLSALVTGIVFRHFGIPRVPNA